jgi:hypothetical protein
MTPGKKLGLCSDGPEEFRYLAKDLKAIVDQSFA